MMVPDDADEDASPLWPLLDDSLPLCREARCPAGA